jgi:hypothetical protein
MQPEGSLPCWQEPATAPYLEPDKSNLRPVTMCGMCSDFKRWDTAELTRLGCLNSVPVTNIFSVLFIGIFVLVAWEIRQPLTPMSLGHDGFIAVAWNDRYTYPNYRIDISLWHYSKEKKFNATCYQLCLYEICSMTLIGKRYLMWIFMRKLETHRARR